MSELPDTLRHHFRYRLFLDDAAYRNDSAVLEYQAPVTLAGLNAGCSASASVAGGKLEAKRSGASLTEGFGPGPITVQDGDQLQLQGRAPLQRGASQTVLLSVGTASAPWVISAADHHEAIPIPVLPGGWPLLLLGLGVLLAYLLARGRRTTTALD